MECLPTFLGSSDSFCPDGLKNILPQLLWWFSKSKNTCRKRNVCSLLGYKEIKRVKWEPTLNIVPVQQSSSTKESFSLLLWKKWEVLTLPSNTRWSGLWKTCLNAIKPQQQVPPPVKRRKPEEWKQMFCCPHTFCHVLERHTPSLPSLRRLTLWNRVTLE